MSATYDFTMDFFIDSASVEDGYEECKCNHMTTEYWDSHKTCKVPEYQPHDK